MRKALGIIISATLILAAQGALGHTTQERTESGTLFAGSVAFVFNPCGALGDVDGTGFQQDHYRLDEEWDWHAFELTMDATLDVDTNFYREDEEDGETTCTLIGNGDGGDGFLGETETGFVEPQADFIIVRHFAGFGSYELTLTTDHVL